MTACSDDVYDEMDQQNEQNEANSGMQTNSFEDSDPGWINIGGGGPFINRGSGYQSPWDIWFRNDPFTPIYSFSNRGTSGHTSPLKLEIIPWVGLAYFDDNDDGFYTDLRLAQQTGGSGIVANMNNGNYPTLFFNNQEVGNLVPGDAITLDGSYIDESELTIASDPSLTPHEHLLANAGNKHLSGFNNLNKVFRFSSLTSQEQDLLMKYGKVFYYQVRITERVSGNPVGAGTYYVQYRNETLEAPSPHYKDIPGYTGNTLGTPLTSRVYYYHNQTTGFPNETQWSPGPYPTNPGGGPSYTCNSREVVIEKVFGEHIKFTGYAGIPWEIYVTIPIGSYLWQTSGPMLVVRPQ